MKQSVICLLGLTFLVNTAIAQQVAAPPPEAERGDMGAMLMQGLREVDGCLGVKTCEWNDDKRTIVAWFEDKQAAVDWYYSDTHMGMIGSKTDSEDDREPMVHVPDDVGPVMVFATLTPSDRPRLEGIDIPISQISIELYTPLPGGAQVGGRVTPQAVSVPYMRDYGPPLETLQD